MWGCVCTFGSILWYKYPILQNLRYIVIVDTINNSSQSNRLYKDITNSPQRNHYLFELDLKTQDDMPKKGKGY